MLQRSDCQLQREAGVWGAEMPKSQDQMGAGGRAWVQDPTDPP